MLTIFAIPKRKNGVIAQLVEQRTENPCVPGSIPGDTTKDKALKIRLLISLQTLKVQHKTLKKSDVLHFFVSDWVMMQKVVGNYRLFCAGFVDIFSEKEIPLDKRRLSLRWPKKDSRALVDFGILGLSMKLNMSGKALQI